MTVISADTVWAKIVAKNIYEVVGSSIIPEGVNQNVSISQFEKAIEHFPLENTAEIQDLRGSSYIYSILMKRPHCMRVQHSGFGYSYRFFTFILSISMVSNLRFDFSSQGDA